MVIKTNLIIYVHLQVIYHDPLGRQHIRKAKLNLVDLAGSERHGKTGISTNSGDAFTESKVGGAGELSRTIMYEAYSICVCNKHRV